MSSNENLGTEAFFGILGLIILGMLISLVMLVGLFAIPVAAAGGIFYFFYKLANPTPKDTTLEELREKVEACAPMERIDFANAVYEKLKYDVLIGEAIAELYEWEELETPPPFPEVITPIEAGRYKDKAAKFLNNHQPFDLVDAMVHAFEPLVIDDGKGPLLAMRALKVEEVQNIAPRFQHDYYFKRVHALLSRNRESAKTAEDFVRDTPLDFLLERPIRKDIKDRFAHTLIMGTTGSGKTQLMQYLISEDLETDCTIIVIDNQRQMIPKLARLGVDMQYLSPRYDLALNLFDMPRGHTTAPLMRYILSGIMNAPLTPKQSIVFQFATNVLLANRGNIDDFHRMLQGDRPDLSKVDETTKRFMETEFFEKDYKSTREEISWRVWTLLQNDKLRQMFLSKDNRCHLELDRKLILIDCDVDVLQDYSGMFGRIFLAQLQQIAQDRFVGSHRPVYVYIDEAYNYLDESVTRMLETARKGKVGVTIANHFLGQISDTKVAASVRALTNAKFASNLDAADLNIMASAMRTSPDYLQGVPSLKFAFWQTGDETVTIDVPTGVIENMPRHDIPHEEMKERYGRQKVTEPTPDGGPDDDGPTPDGPEPDGVPPPKTQPSSNPPVDNAKAPAKPDAVDKVEEKSEW